MNLKTIKRINQLKTEIATLTSDKQHAILTAKGAHINDRLTDDQLAQHLQQIEDRAEQHIGPLQKELSKLS